MNTSKHAIINTIYAKLACMGIRAYKISNGNSYYYKSPVKLGKRKDRKGKIRTIRISDHLTANTDSTLSIKINKNTDIWKVIDYITDLYY